MSTVIMTACWPLQGMSATHKAVLISLADNANDDGVCWPSVQRISERTCLSERAVRNALRWLETAKAISSNQRYGRSSWYTITPAHYAPGTTCPPAPDAPQPRHDVPLTPAPRAPRTVKEPSVEPSEVVDEPKAVVPKLEPQKIVDLFNEILSHELPAVTLLNDDRKAKLKARWNQHPAHQCLDFWADYFETVRASAFLMGKAPGKNGGAPFRATFDWLIAPTNFVKVVEGNYHA